MLYGQTKSHLHLLSILFIMGISASNYAISPLGSAP